jgi:hypothetical protein
LRHYNELLPVFFNGIGQQPTLFDEFKNAHIAAVVPLYGVFVVKEFARAAKLSFVGFLI